MEMLTTKRQLLAITAVLAAVVMATGTGVAELVAQPHIAAHQIRITQRRPPAAPLVAPPVEDGEST